MVPLWRRRCRVARARSRLRCWIKEWSPASVTSMPAKLFMAHAFPPGASRTAFGVSAPRDWPGRSATFFKKRSRPAAAACGITCKPPGNWATFSTLGRSMAARVRPVRIAPVAGRRGAASAACSREVVPPSTVRTGSVRKAAAWRPSRGINMAYENIQVETRDGVGVITLHRPAALNALCTPLVDEVGEALRSFDADPAIGCIVLTGSDKAFAAGADIKEVKEKSYQDVVAEDFITGDWEVITTIRKPVIAAVAGYALGGGCEFAMMCDFIIAADTARFGQPEIKLGTIPGAGGTQRLTRSVGKSLAMYLCLTGDMIDAETALRSGLVAKVVPADELMEETMKAAKTIAGLSQPVVSACKEAVNRAYETTLSEGVRFERRLFHSTFALEDRREGMTAFSEKRKPEWKHG